MQLELEFRNEAQKLFFNLTQRNTCFSGGFCNGKTYIGCMKLFLLLSTFRNYRAIIARQYYSDLRRTTMETFFKICPRDFIARHSEQEKITVLKNNSQVYWMHLDTFDENSLRGIEINSALIDQAEEISEAIYLILDSRIGRWDKAEVPESMLTPDWPRDNYGRPRVPNYMMILCNPDNEYHWIYRRYHPDSPDRLPNHIMIQAPTDPGLSDPETYKQMLTRDEEWVKRYVRGEWGISEAQIHYVYADSILEPDQELLDRIKKKGNLFRVLDHGDSSPTCCLWFAVLDGNYICYREYYMPNLVISQHRQNIHDLSFDEVYTANYADPTIFHRKSQKDGGFWSVADEYMTPEIKSPPLFWIPADNNEFATRNRINELLRKVDYRIHPITKASPAPGLYFIKRTPDYPYGCFYAINELKAQRREKLGEINGKTVYSDDREKGIADHAYDCIRYFVAMHGTSKSLPPKPAPARSFHNLLRIRKRNASMMRTMSGGIYV